MTVVDMRLSADNFHPWQSVALVTLTERGPDPAGRDEIRPHA